MNAPFLAFDQRRVAAVFASMAIGACGLAAGAAPEPAQPLTGTEIYVKMRAAVNALTVPAYVAFTEQDASTRKYALLQDRLRIVVRMSDAHAWVRTIKNMNGDAVQVEPHVVTGMVYPQTPIERVGEFPLADFGLRPRRPGQTGIFEAPGTPEPTPSPGPLKAIGSVTGYNLSYRVVNLGDTGIGGTPVYHLGLFPYRDPGHNVLRQVWIDQRTFIPKRYVAERFVENGGLSFRYLITVNTVVIEGHLVNIDADGHFEIHRALIVNVAGDGRWAISDVRFPTDPPGWLFDPDHYKDHAGDAVPDL